MGYEIKPFPYDGTVDADGHVLEPAWLWEHYLESKYADRAMRVEVDDRGLEYLSLDGRPSEKTRNGVLGLMGAMGDDSAVPSPDRKYMDNIPYGAGDPNERLTLLDKEHLDAALLYPTVSLLWECEVTDPEITLAYMRAYNRWIADFCRDSAGGSCRRSPDVARPEGSAASSNGRWPTDAGGGGSRRSRTPARDTGIRTTTCSTRRPSSSTCRSRSTRPYEPDWTVPVRFDKLGKAREFHYNVTLRQGIQQALLTFYDYGTFDRFPTLKLGVLESGMGWVGSFLDRADAVFETMSGRGVPISSKPSEIFARQCFISGDPDETAAPLIMDHVGAQCFMWATDYPHPDHPGTWVDSLTRLVEPLSEPTRAAFLGDNVRRIFGLTV
jgi:hypothetical protein